RKELSFLLAQDGRLRVGDPSQALGACELLLAALDGQVALSGLRLHSVAGEAVALLDGAELALHFAEDIGLQSGGLISNAFLTLAALLGFTLRCVSAARPALLAASAMAVEIEAAAASAPCDTLKVAGKIR